jgi:hypothetical protein
MAMGQHALGHHNPNMGGRTVRAVWIELPALLKTCTFPVVTLHHPHFNPISCWTVTTPAGFWGKGSAPAQVIMLAYSHVGKNGGVLWMYEAAPRKGLSADQLMHKIADAGFFKEHAHAEGWSIRPTVVGGTVVGPSSYVPYAIDDAIAAVKG